MSFTTPGGLSVPKEEALSDTISRKEVEKNAEQFIRRTQKLGGQARNVPQATFKSAVKATVDQSLKVLRAQGVKIQG